MLEKVKRILFLIFNKFFLSDYFSRRFPVSIKGVIIVDDKVILLKNEKNEWDLPGGKLGKNETPKDCLEREVLEELNLKVLVKEIEESMIVNVHGKIKVLVIIYSCHLIDELSKAKVSFEHEDIGYFTSDGLNKIQIYDDYKKLLKKRLSSIKSF